MTNLSDSVRAEISATSRRVMGFYDQEFKKINIFFQYKLMDITRRWLEIKTNCIALVSIQESRKRD